MHLFGDSSGALIHRTEEVPEPAAFAALRYHAESDFVADQDYGFGSCAREPHESLELLQNLALVFTEHPRRDPEGEGVKENNGPSFCSLEYGVQASAFDLQEPPIEMAPLPMILDTPCEIRVVGMSDGGRDVENVPAA
jgi:hypothetical protein